MARCPIVSPKSTTVSLSDGETIELKKQLNAGEYRDMLAGQFKDVPDGETRVDLKNIGFSKILAYLVGWSFDGLDGKPLPVSADTINAIDTDTFREILALVETHHAAIEEASAARKNVPGTPSESATT